MSDSPVRIAVDASRLVKPITGIGQYTWQLCSRLLQDPRFRFDFFYGYGWSADLKQIEVPHLGPLRRFVLKWIPRPYEVSRAMQQVRFSQGVRRFDPHVFHEPNILPYAFDGPIVLTVHDLSWIRHPETHPALRVRIMDKLFPRAIEAASHILTDSEFVRGELVRDFGVDPGRVTTTLLGVADEFHPRPLEACAEVARRHGLVPGRYVLAVGTLEPRKNLALALEAYARLREPVRARWPLAVVGMKGWKTTALRERIERLSSQGALKLLGYVTADDLPFLYAGARALVYPSLYEGFGLPVGEAMASGTPVIVSDRASLPEVAGGAGLIVDPGDADAAAQAITRLCTDDASWEHHRTLGLAQARRLDWNACARATADVYLSTLAGR